MHTVYTSLRGLQQTAPPCIAPNPSSNTNPQKKKNAKKKKEEKKQTKEKGGRGQQESNL